MIMDDYILRSLSKISRKRWEHYAINRIYHRLNDPEIEFICQQCIRSGSRIYLADLYFPQLNIYVEIDEGHHESDAAKINDAKRSFDIVEAAGLIELRISATNVSLAKFNENLDTCIENIRKRKYEVLSLGNFTAWDYERRFTAEPHITAGHMHVGPRSAFRTHMEALKCFGYTKGHYQRATWNLPKPVRDQIGLTGKCTVWFPKLYEQAYWENSLSDDGMTIIEKNKDPNHIRTEPWDKRIVMARSRDEFNSTLYRFLGVFEIMPDYRTGNEHRFQRVSAVIKTYGGH